MPNYNYNDFYNPYRNNFYNGYTSQMPQYPQMPIQQMPQVQQQNVAQSNQQTIYMPLAFVNGIEGAKSQIVNPNTTVYLRDSDSNLFFEKTSDEKGKCTIVAYKLEKIDLNNYSETNSNTTNKVEYVTKSDLASVESVLQEKIDKLSMELKNEPREFRNNARDNYRDRRN